MLSTLNLMCDSKSISPQSSIKYYFRIPRNISTTNMINIHLLTNTFSPHHQFLGRNTFCALKRTRELHNRTSPPVLLLLLLQAMHSSSFCRVLHCIINYKGSPTRFPFRHSPGPPCLAERTSPAADRRVVQPRGSAPRGNKMKYKSAWVGQQSISCSQLKISILRTLSIRSSGLIADKSAQSR